MNRHHKIPLIAGILFLLANIISVACAWLSGNHLFDLGISFSAYIGLNRWTSVLWFCFAVIIAVLMIVYIQKIRIPVVKKVIYYIVLIGISGTAFFPFNTFSEHPTSLTINLHNYFGIGLMLVTTVSFVLSLIMSKTKKHKITAICSLIFAVVFVVSYFLRIPFLFRFFYIWENAFIILLFLELYMEQFEE